MLEPGRYIDQTRPSAHRSDPGGRKKGQKAGHELKTPEPVLLTGMGEEGTLAKA